MRYEKLLNFMMLYFRLNIEQTGANWTQLFSLLEKSEPINGGELASVEPGLARYELLHVTSVSKHRGLHRPRPLPVGLCPSIGCVQVYIPIRPRP